MAKISSCQEAFADYLSDRLSKAKSGIGVGAGLGIAPIGVIKDDRGKVTGKVFLCKTYVNVQTTDGPCSDQCSPPVVKETGSDRLVAHFTNGAKADPYIGEWCITEPEDKSSHMMEPLFDINGNKSTDFFRHVITDALGNVTVVNTTTDGVTPYTPTGTVSIRDIKEVVQTIVLCDTPTDGCDPLDNAECVPFIRHLSYDTEGKVICTTDTKLDGISPYETIGKVGDCGLTRDGENILLCDDCKTFIRHFVYEQKGKVVSSYDTEIDGKTKYITTGPVVTCSSNTKDAENIVLCDTLRDGTTKPFIRHYIYDTEGVVESYRDTGIDGVTPYALVGDVTLCDSSKAAKDAESEILRDVSPDGTSKEFIRHYVYNENGDVVSFYDTELDGTTPYTPSGTISTKGLKRDVESLVFCDLDASGVSVSFIRHFINNEDGKTLSLRDTTLDGTTSYTPVGTVKLCSTGKDVEVIPLCDVSGFQQNNKFFRHIVHDSEGEVSSVYDTEEDGFTPYTITGFVQSCNPIIENKILCDHQPDGSVVEFIRQYTMSSTGVTRALRNLKLDSTRGLQSYTITGEVRSCDNGNSISTEVGCVSPAASDDLFQIERCPTGYVLLNGERLDVTLPQGWQAKDMADAVNAIKPNTLLDNSGILVAPGQTSMDLKIICRDDIISQSFGTGGSNGNRVQSTATNYTFKGSGQIDQNEYTITSFQDTGLAPWMNGNGVFTADATGNPAGNVMMFDADANPGEFFRQRINVTPGKKYSVRFFVANTNDNPAGIDPNIKVEIQDVNNSNVVVKTYQTGSIGFSGQWREFEFDYVPTGFVFDFVLINNAPGGTGNDLAIDQITFHSIERQSVQLRSRGSHQSIEIVKVIEPDGTVINSRVLYPDGMTEYVFPEGGFFVLSTGDCQTYDESATNGGDGTDILNKQARVVSQLLCAVSVNTSTVTSFIRHYVYDDQGNAIDVRDTTLDGFTPYVANPGQPSLITNCANAVDSEHLILCDTDPSGVTNKFMRHYLHRIGGRVGEIRDTTLDGVTIYNPSASGVISVCDTTTVSEIGCVSSAASADIFGVDRCEVSYLNINGERFNVTLPQEWQAQELVDAVNAIRPNTLLNNDGSIVAPGQVSMNIEVVCRNSEFSEDFGTGGMDGNRVMSSATNYNFINSGQINQNDYTVTSFQDTGLAAWMNGGGAFTSDATGDVTGNVIMFDADDQPGEFYRQAVTITKGKNYSVRFYVANTNAVGAILPNILVNIESSASSAILSAFQTGDINYVGDWAEFEFNFTATESNVDFVLVNNAPGGNGNDLAIDEITFNSVSRQRINLRSRGLNRPVEIIKGIRPDGSITGTRVYSSDGTEEITLPNDGSLVLSTGECQPFSGAGTGIVNEQSRIESEVLCAHVDPSGAEPGSVTSFIRNYIYSDEGEVISTTDLTIDGSQEYAAPDGATVGPCGGTKVTSQTLCDFTASGDSISFVRHFVYREDGTLVTSYSTNLDGSSPYIPSGEVAQCDRFRTVNEIGYLAGPISVDLCEADKCRTTEVIVDGDTLPVDLQPGWTVEEFVNQVNAERPNTFVNEGSKIFSTRGNSVSNIEIICSPADFLEDFGNQNGVPNGVPPGQTFQIPPGATTTYNYEASGDIIAENSYHVGRLKDIRDGVSGATMGMGLAAVDAAGNSDGNVIAFNGAPTPGIFYGQIASGLIVGQEYQFRLFIGNLAEPAGDDPNTRPNVTLEILDGTDIIASKPLGDIVGNGQWQPNDIKFVAPATSLIYRASNSATVATGNDLVIDQISFSRVERQKFQLTPQQEIIPVEIIKQISRDGEINSLRVWSPDATIEYQIPDPSGRILGVGQAFIQPLPETQRVIVHDQGCASGEQWVKRTVSTFRGCAQSDDISYIDSTGTSIGTPPPGFTLGPC